MNPTSDFLSTMSASSFERLRIAMNALSQVELDERIAALSQLTLRPLNLKPFNVIAEVKRRSPALGALNQHDLSIESRVSTYADHGASVISVLTEPSRFDGDLNDLTNAYASAGSVPLMRKDFIVDPYQVSEARVRGASGVLLIVRMLPLETLIACLRRAQDLGMFVLLEVFDETELKNLNQALLHWTEVPQRCMVGVNSRNLATLKVDTTQLYRLVDQLPSVHPKVAESGLESPADAERLAAAGYDVALVGGALMKATDPGRLLAQMIAAGLQGGERRS